MSKVQVKVGSLTFKNPILLASGTCGNGKEINKFYNINILGGFVTKSITINPREGNPNPRIWESYAGILNSIGLENAGLDKFLEEEIPFLEKLNTNVIVSIAGEKKEEYYEIARVLRECKISGIEINLSCPNVEGGGMLFGIDSEMVKEITKNVVNIVDKPVWVKLTPQAKDIIGVAKAVRSAGGEAVVVFNTFLGLAIDWKKREPVFKRIFAGYSGPAIKPIVLRYVWELYEENILPIVGCGGIVNFTDVLEYIFAGASLVQIGSANFRDPWIGEKIVKEVQNYFKEEKVVDLIGIAHKNHEEVDK
ncbi:MAG: dihydroorotate dehydrogenase [Dictyoglomus turgidum]|uniref:Dihydroorotate dehydrogenase n=1 Tax=Dictyoglomus turgidum (strain DSM 6724 / Z-1310) TaxID=515635 RepID=B8E2K2_DICTD|nr:MULTISPECIES: dihydroorotate dehydrogenase [Dictyoglomus]ACK42846.1 dihydroorotate dehydrogenase family protein [Dictyoglomus turgidum DSM 6724]HBU30905.1 dihydroorotate dehydrogenase [Dictyoglomus sp.]